MESWPGNTEAAKKIFEFFGISYVVRDLSGMKIYEGNYMDKLLAIVISLNEDREFGSQFRHPVTHRDLGGALLHTPKEIDFCTEQKVSMTDTLDIGEEYKYMVIVSGGGNISISRDGVHATID